MYEIFERLLNERKLKTSDVVRGTGLNATFFSEWKKGKSKNPNPVSLQKIADFFGVSVDYLMNGKESEYIIEMAKTDVELSLMEDRLKAYALKLAKLPKDKQAQIMSLIDMLEDK